MKTRFLTGRRSGFTLVEIMIVVAIIALLASIAVPGRLIDGAVDMYAIENNKSSGNQVLVRDWTKYMKTGTNLFVTGRDILGNAYGNQTVDSIPRVNSTSKTALSDVTDNTFWSPYN